MEVWAIEIRLVCTCVNEMNKFILVKSIENAMRASWMTASMQLIYEMELNVNNETIIWTQRILPKFTWAVIFDGWDNGVKRARMMTARTEPKNFHQSHWFMLNSLE